MSTAAVMTGACKRCETPVETYDLRCTVCAQPTDKPADTVREGPVAEILRCRECAAAVAYTVEAEAPRCAFCDSVMEVERPVDPVEEAEYVLPFLVERDAARAALKRWLGTLGWFRPRDLASEATVDTLHPLYWAAWIFDADAVVTWAADSDAGSGRSAWAPHAGTARFTWDNILVSASRGLTHKEAAALAPGFRLERARPAKDASDDGDGGDGAQVETFDLQRSAARRKIVDTIEAIAAGQLQSHGHIPGSRFRKVHVSVLLARLVTRRYSLPTWVLAYRYKGSVYRALVHGQDESITFGSAPLSWAKIALLVLLGLALAAAAVYFFGVRA